jgi:hypothetical protein
MNLGTTSKAAFAYWTSCYLSSSWSNDGLMYHTFIHFHNDIPYIHKGVVNDNVTKYEVCPSKYYSYCL